MSHAGILLPVASLPSVHGVGDFGPKAYQFIKLLKKSQVKLWQVLPLNPLGYGNSPYQPYSSKAMDELYISLTLLKKEGLIKAAPSFNNLAKKIDYQAVRDFKQVYLKEAFLNFKADKKYNRFINKNRWVKDYATFISLKKDQDQVAWLYWKKEYRDYGTNKQTDLSAFNKAIAYEMFLQYILFRQWRALKKYANHHHIQIIGDIPIYVGIDSVDVWMNRHLFLLDETGHPTFIAGVPPDYFSKLGQRWGNPLYDWDKLKQTNFAFWIDRLGYNAQLFDYIRIDHFRAFDSYWAIPAQYEDAVIGQWWYAPGYHLFDTINKQLPTLKIIAEDLGDLRPEVLVLRDHYELPGMKIVQFSFDFNKKPIYKVASNQNMIIYPGTHDNDTVRGWYLSLTKPQRNQVRQYVSSYGQNNVVKDLICLTLNSAQKMAIIPMQDILGHGTWARLNVPGTINDHNWSWKMSSFSLFKKQLVWLKKQIIAANRK